MMPVATRIIAAPLSATSSSRSIGRDGRVGRGMVRLGHGEREPGAGGF